MGLVGPALRAQDPAGSTVVKEPRGQPPAWSGSSVSSTGGLGFGVVSSRRNRTRQVRDVVEDLDGEPAAV